jgi:hypothetical protein
MLLFSPPRIGLIAALLIAPLFLPAQESNKEGASKGMPPRTGPSEYQAHAQAGNITIGAEFMGHAVPTPEQMVQSEEYIVVEAGLFGPPNAHATLARSDFSLRVNGKKVPLPAEPLELVYKSLKDPEWQPPVPAESKSKGGLTTGGGGDSGGDKLPPIPPKMPFELRRAMEQHVQRAAMLEGDRPLPQAGLLFFSYRGKAESIRSIELIYSGAAGSATLDLQP